MPRRKQFYKINYPNGKIDVGVDLMGATVVYFGSPSPGTKERMAAELAEHRLGLTRRQVLPLNERRATSDSALRQIGPHAENGRIRMDLVESPAVTADAATVRVVQGSTPTLRQPIHTLTSG